MSTHRLPFPLAARLRLTGARLARMPSRLLGIAALRRSRRALGRLDDHLLRDIGLTRSEALAEADRLGWDAPSHWKA